MYLTIARFVPFAKIICAMSVCAEPCLPALKAALADPSVSVSAPKKQCPQTHSLIRWLKAKSGGATFQEIAEFMKEHPQWPFQETLQKNAEAALARASLSDSQIIDWFAKFSPLTCQGVECYVDALRRAGRSGEAKKVVAAVWPKVEMTESQQQNMCVKYASLLTPHDHFARSSHLLNQDHSLGEKLIAHLPEKFRIILRARLIFKNNLKNKVGDPENRFSRLTHEQRQDPGLIYDYLRSLRAAEENKGMAAVFEKFSDHLDPQLVVRERHILTRRLMDEERYQDAYKVIKEHRLTKGEDFANSEWLAGWIALRGLKKPEIAEKHFRQLLENVSSPISVARATYWLGRTHDAQKQHKKAHECYSKAACHPGTYYGQLAHEKLQGEKPKVALAALKTPPEVQKKFHQRPFVIALKLLGKASAPDHHLMPFVLALSKDLSLQERPLLIELAAQLGSTSLAVHTTKHVTKTELPMIPQAFPLISKALKPHIKGDIAFVHAIIRQESRFQADAVSSAGAMGLMQIMPATAQQISKKFGVSYKKLTDTKSNVTLGSHHLKDLLEHYKGSHILAAAAYNAGAEAVNQWLEQYGDPRDPTVDTCDWVEKIPYAETRNYVQRVMENLHCYRGR